MAVARKRKTVPKTAARRPSPSSNGDARIGRPSMFPGKNLDKHRSTYMTDEGWALAEQLREHHANKLGFTPSDGDIFEDAIRYRAADVFRSR